MREARVPAPYRRLLVRDPSSFPFGSGGDYEASFCVCGRNERYEDVRGEPSRCDAKGPWTFGPGCRSRNSLKASFRFPPFLILYALSPFLDPGASGGTAATLCHAARAAREIGLFRPGV